LQREVTAGSGRAAKYWYEAWAIIGLKMWSCNMGFEVRRCTCATRIYFRIGGKYPFLPRITACTHLSSTLSALLLQTPAYPSTLQILIDTWAMWISISKPPRDSTSLLSTSHRFKWYSWWRLIDIFFCGVYSMVSFFVLELRIPEGVIRLCYESSLTRDI
jgi:hypothetical protein